MSIRFRLLLLSALLALGGFAAISCRAASPSVKLKQVLSGLQQPVHLIGRGKRLYITEQTGRVRMAEAGKLLAAAFLDIRGRVRSGGEMGLLSLAFHPGYPKVAKVYVDYTADQGGLHTRISEFSIDPRNGLAKAGSERVLLRIPQPYENHNGGQIAFGPDGMLYIGMGDGGSGGDPHGNGQNGGSLLGKLLRIDVNASPYKVPGDNPFVGKPGYRPEIWAIGLRNPWRFSFDRASRLLYVADVGQNAWEEVDIVRKGGNYGWNRMEGRHCFEPARGCNSAGLQLPIAEYGHDLGNSITGGYVYRGGRFKALQGIYFYADFGSGRLFGLRYDGKRVSWQQQLLNTGLNLSSFGEDAAGEIYLLDYGGKVFQIEG
ncbi:MAG TPA: PQQ-dependent sugar dehydrogenase [Candidatus Obscuribacterales bacterium]